MDKLLRTEIINEVKRSMREALEVADERWINGEELCNQFQMFSPSWLKLNGHLLPRTRAEVADKSGKTTGTRWAYPQHRIARMIAENKIKEFILTT
jgi:hypothetical protein